MTQRSINGFSLWRGSYPIILLGAVFVVLPFILPYTSLATEIMLFALAAVAFDLCVGYTGVMMFCQASFFGMGAYATALTLVHLTDNIFLAMLSGVAMSDRPGRPDRVHDLDPQRQLLGAVKPGL